MCPSYVATASKPQEELEMPGTVRPDGATAIPLMAAVEGWPASPWVQPRTPEPAVPSSSTPTDESGWTAPSPLTPAARRTAIS